MNVNLSYINQYDEIIEDINELASNILDPKNKIIRRGWFILGYGDHSPYWINTYDLCKKLHLTLYNIISKIMKIDNSTFQAIPWSQETASYSFHLSNLVDNCFDFRVGTDSIYQKELERSIHEIGCDRVTLVGDLAVMGTLYVQAVDMLQKANISISHIVIAISRTNQILFQNINKIKERRVKYTSLLEFAPTNDFQYWVLKDLFGNEHGRLDSKINNSDGFEL